MPTLKLSISPAQTAERQQALAAALTQITARALGKRATVTAVLIDERPEGRWHVGGVPVNRPTALLEISITSGTNTAEQKAEFIALAYAELQAQLAPGGDFEVASYVAVHEVPAGDWGYGGVTQAQRLRQPAQHLQPPAVARDPRA